MGIFAFILVALGGGVRDEATSPPFYVMTGACVDNPNIIVIVFFVFNCNKIS